MKSRWHINYTATLGGATTILIFNADALASSLRLNLEDRSEPPAENMALCLIVSVFVTIFLQINAQRKSIPFSELIPSPDDDINYGLYAKLVKDGLPKAKQPKKVIIVGAGAAGLTAGYMLKKAGHQVRQSLKIYFFDALKQGRISLQVYAIVPIALFEICSFGAQIEIIYSKPS